MKNLNESKTNRKMFKCFFLLVVCMAVIALIAIPTSFAQAAPSKSTPNDPIQLCLTGDEWGWGDGPKFQHNESTSLYEVNATFSSSTSLWKIKQTDAWDINYGGSINYTDNKGQFKGVLNGDNLLPPNQSECHIYLKYISNNVAFIGVNMIPEYNEVTLHSNDNISLFNYVIDDETKGEITSATEYFFHDECVKLYIDENYPIDGKITAALIAKNVNNEVVHTCLFKANLGQGYEYVDPSRITHKEDASGKTSEVIVWVSEEPVPTQSVTISCTGEEPFQYFNGTDWIETTSIAFEAANEGKDITIYDEEAANEGVVVISDGHDTAVKIKSAVESVVLDKSRVLFDNTNFKIFVDYNNACTYSVKALDDKGSILPAEEIDVDSFGDCKYVIDGAKLTLTLGTFVKEYTASPADENTFKAWLDANGNEITATDGYLSDFTANGDVEFVASFFGGENPGPDPAEEVNATPQTGDNFALAILAFCAMLSGGILFARRKLI